MYQVQKSKAPKGRQDSFTTEAHFQQRVRETKNKKSSELRAGAVEIQIPAHQ